MKLWLPCLLIILHKVIGIKESYNDKREKLVENNYKQQFGEDLLLNEVEEKVSKFLIKKKLEELDNNEKDGICLQEINFLLARSQIEESEVFKIIQLMPKGWYLFRLITF